MRRTRSRLTQLSTLVAALLLLGITITACGGDNDEDDEVGTTANATATRGSITGTPESRDATPATDTYDAEVGENPDTSPEGSPQAGDVAVPVDLNEFEISMPDTLPAGETTFAIANVGTAPHSFVIEGEGIEESLDENLEPEESATLTVDLEPGTYVVYCPVGNHEDRGMHLELTVTD